MIRAFDAAGLRYALIGGLAMAMRGVQRATLDADFILALEDLAQAHSVLVLLGYRREFHSANVSHYLSQDPALGRIDLLHAFRGPTLGMLERSERLELVAAQTIPVIHIEDLIGLKIQAATNDPKRSRRDWNDIHLLLEHAAHQRLLLDWELIADYLGLFDLQSMLPELKHTYGPTQPS